jgi:NYN domain
MTFLESDKHLYSRSLPHTGAILLDVENFPFKLDLEKYLKSYCLYPITIKLAVANWCHSSIAKLDVYLHQQRYQLIHVPKEKNAADAQLFTLGSSLLLQYPHVKEITIVSGDSIFDYLHQSLQAQGCHTHKVYQLFGNIYLHNYSNNRSSVITTVNNNDHDQKASQTTTKQDSLEQQLKNKIEQSLVKLNKNSTAKITLTQLSQQFKHDYNQSLAEAIKSNKLSGTPSGFLKKNCPDKIQIELQDNNYYLSLKQ